MTPEELASDARKSENAQIRKEALKESERGQHLKKVPYCALIALRIIAVGEGCMCGVWPQMTVCPSACCKHGELIFCSNPRQSAEYASAAVAFARRLV